MYLSTRKEKIVRVPPSRLGEDIDKVITDLTRESFEGIVEDNNSLTVLIDRVEPLESGRIVHGDGAVYQKVGYDALMFRPYIQEVVEGTVCEVVSFGAFISFGPIDGLLHISQVMDDRIDIDQENQKLIGKETKRDLKVGDAVRARIVALSLNERNPKESKIGLTMRQTGLGKLEWLEEDRKAKGDA